MTAKVVLVSGDKDLTCRTKALFTEAKLALDVFGPAEFSLSQLIQNRPDLLLVGVAGGQDDEGLSIIQSMRTREHLRKIPIIALAGNVDKPILLAIQRAGVSDVLAQAGREDELKDRILKYCGPAVQAKHSPSGIGAGKSAQAEWSDPETTAFKKLVQRDVRKRLELLPTLPIVVMEIMQLADDDTSSASDFEEHISHDQALSARLLRIANSSFFGQSRRITSIRDAIVILGLRTLKSLTLAASTSKILDRPAEGYGYQSGGLWKHSIGCAVGSRLLAKQMGKPSKEVEELFVLGLLHDIGKLLLNNFVVEKAEEFREAIGERKLSILQAENEVLGTDHCEIGLAIAEQWVLPPEVKEAITFHHLPQRAKKWPEQVAIVHFVDYLVHDLGIGKIPGSIVKPKLNKEAARLANLSESTIKNVRDEFQEQMEEMEKLFSMVVS